MKSQLIISLFFCLVPLQILPLLTLHQYLATFMCRDLQRAVGGRILRVSVLTDAGLFTEAFVTLQRLLHGERLPHTADSNFRQMESTSSNLKFDTSKGLLDPTNLKVGSIDVHKIRILFNIMNGEEKASLRNTFWCLDWQKY